MNCANIIIIGKTGAGKSTLVNAILGKDRAPAGKGGAITKENKVYTCKKKIESKQSKRMEKWKIKIYDTVGLEIDEHITKSTLVAVKKYLDNVNKSPTDKDITIVWLCINQKCNRVEEYELAVVDEMSLEYEIPFSVIFTQCISETVYDVEAQLKKFRNVDTKRVLAKDYKTRVGVFQAFGVEEAVQESICTYNQSKIGVLESKLDLLQKKRERIEQQMQGIEREAKDCIEKHEKSARKIGVLPVGCIPFVHGICIKMISDVNRIAGIHMTDEYVAEIFANVIVGMIVTPFMAVPIVSSFVACSYVEVIGKTYLDALLAVIRASSEEDLGDNIKMTERIVNELKKRNGE